jgi:DNA ligase (NAD+)
MIERIKELIETLNMASKQYEEGMEIMTNFEYDRFYDELLELEKNTGIIFSNSPTQKVGFEVQSLLPKEEHENPMLSLDKTKDLDALAQWLGNQEGMLSSKLDGLTIVLTYEEGKLVKAVTRGNGTVGEVVTNNAKMFKNIPMVIPYKGRLILRGEAVIHYSDFVDINRELDVLSQYKNPRNLCSGSVRQLSNEVTKQRHVRFYAFSLILLQDNRFTKKIDELNWLKSQGFGVVETVLVTQETLRKSVQEYALQISTSDIGSDGLVLTFNDKDYSKDLGRTSKFPKDSIAFKWQDEECETILREVFWSASRTGLINPVAIFDPVELEGTSVARASLHNISIIEKLQLGLEDRIRVYKANMIIPQISENLTKSNNLEIPTECPVCSHATKVENQNDIKALYCTNTSCPAKKIKAFAHFVSRNAMNIEGLSEATLEKLIELGLIHEFVDLFSLEQPHIREHIITIEGFGEKSYQNLISAINASKQVRLANFIYALGILQVGLSNAKLLCKAIKNDMQRLYEASVEELQQIEGFGSVIAKSIVEYFQNPENRKHTDALLDILQIESESFEVVDSRILGKTFVITGSLNFFENRDALKDKIEALGGKVSGSVSSKTDFLINNDQESSSSKNKKALSLGVAIISEEDFMRLIE